MSNDIGSRIDLARKNAGYSQKQLANLAGITEKSINRYIHGETIPNAKQIGAIALCLGVSSDYLICGKNEKFDPLADVRKEFIAKIREIEGYDEWDDAAMVASYQGYRWNAWNDISNITRKCFGLKNIRHVEEWRVNAMVNFARNIAEEYIEQYRIEFELRVNKLKETFKED